MEWRQGSQPNASREFFNMKYSWARNVIERCFGLLKLRWAILSSKPHYPVKIQCRIINACALLHNFIRQELSMDLIEVEVAEDVVLCSVDVHQSPRYDGTHSPPCHFCAGYRRADEDCVLNKPECIVCSELFQAGEHNTRAH